MRPARRDWQLVGRSGHWKSVRPTAAMIRSAAVGQEIVPNDRLAHQATAAPDPSLPFGSIS